MAYVPTYASTDLGPIAIDGIGTIGVTMVAFAAIIGIIFVYKYIKGEKINI